MARFDSDGLSLAYIDQGPPDGEPIVLVHGFGSNVRVNWIGPGWVDALVGAGRRVVAIDNRGHGASEGPHDPALYDTGTCMAEDVRRLMDHLGIARADVMGYSMGAWITGHLAVRHPERLRSAIFGGLAMAMIDGLGGQEAIAVALEAARDEDVTSPIGRTYRAFGKQTGSDLLALAACMRGSRRTVDRAALAALDLPVLVAVGTKDTVAGSLDEFVALIPGAEALAIPGRDHMQAVGDKVHKQGVLAFLARRP
ncbi:alpha/beta fold hydrolase [Siculibacillus lacustris]|uniref:Alpha/beta fold hydrolase n=1 Tax=Siculibacillus lacustris TaxID=1549641 RepID=A0A4Q9VG07_9HYPH|nr:alpha/beta fold hydrolase [Siculibacillus lacustris]TBW33895.1 alpha/beta fold hydrolase [Siculibacillus lacustris]